MTGPKRAPESADPARSDGRRRRGDKARAAILARAVEVASIEGLEGLTIGGLAAGVGTGKANISILFGNKEALQLATLDAAGDIFVKQVVKPALRSASHLDRLRQLTDGWFRYVDRRTLPGGCMMYGSMNEYRARPGALQDGVRRQRDAWMRLLAATIREAQKGGEIRRDLDPAQLVFELTAFQSAANAAALLGDRATFARARRTAKERINAVAVSGKTSTEKTS